MSKGKHIRNVVILLLIAAAVWGLPGGGSVTAGVMNILTIAFVGALLFFGYRVYIDHRNTIYGLGDRLRAVLYGSVALAAFAFIATTRLWQNGWGTLVWFVLIGVAAWGIFTVFRAASSY